MLILENVNSGYGDAQVLNQVSLEVRRGEAVALLGRNGMGKSTTLLTVMGIVEHRAGRILFKGEAISGRPSFEIARRGIGFAPEGRRLFATLTVEQNLKIPFVNKHPDKSQWRKELANVFELFPRLQERRNQIAGSLSGGEQQMCAIARAIIGGDDLLLLDEPTEGIAPAIVQLIVEAIIKLKELGRTILIVEQNLGAAFTVADRGYVLEKGKIVLEGSTRDLKSDAMKLERYLGVAEGQQTC